MASERNQLQNSAAVRQPRRRIKDAFAEIEDASPASAVGVADEDLRVIAIEAARQELATSEQYAARIARLWREAERRFLDIGRLLIEAKERLLHGDFLPMVERELPFSRQMAFKLMKVTAFVDRGEIPSHQLPCAAETLYQITTLAPEERERAIAENVIRPDTRRDDVIAFKRQVRSTVAQTADRQAQLEAKRERLLRQLVEIEQELSELSANVKG
jgi:hypothetical protein